jgi:hypothetical protein
MESVFTMTSVTDGSRLCRARICSGPGMSMSQASLPGGARGRNYANYPEALFHGLQKRYGGRHTAIGR